MSVHGSAYCAKISSAPAWHAGGWGPTARACASPCARELAHAALALRRSRACACSPCAPSARPRLHTLYPICPNPLPSTHARSRRRHLHRYCTMTAHLPPRVSCTRSCAATGARQGVRGGKDKNGRTFFLYSSVWNKGCMSMAIRCPPGSVTKSRPRKGRS